MYESTEHSEEPQIDILAEKEPDIRRFGNTIKELVERTSKIDLTQPDKDLIKVQYQEAVLQTMQHHYGENMEVPRSFIRDNPSIVFLPFDERYILPYHLNAQTIDPPQNQKLRKSVEEHELVGAKTVDIQSFTKAMGVVLDELDNENLGLINQVAYLTAFTYTCNLELFALTRDKSAMIYRWTDNPDEETIAFEDLRKNGGTGPVNPALIALAEYRHVTHWALHTTTIRYGRQLIQTSLEEVEKDHFVALDSAEVCALMLLSK